MSHKEQLKVRSEWICEVDCRGRCFSHHKSEVGQIRNITATDVWFVSPFKEDEIPIEEFLACFVPM